MKKSIFTKILCLLALCAGLSLTACDTANSSPESTESSSVEEHSHSFVEGQCAECGEWSPYDILYTSNGDGTCYVSEIVTYPQYTQDFTLSIPEKSPDGDTVTAIRAEPFSSIPQLLAVEDFEEIMSTLQKAVDDGKLHPHYRNKFVSYFIYYDLDNLSANQASALLEKYPIAEVTDIVVLDPLCSAAEIAYISQFLGFYTNYSSLDLAADYEHLRELVNASSVANKEEILETIPSTSMSNVHRITALDLPNTLVEVDLAWIESFTKLQDLTIPACVQEIPEYFFQYNASIRNVCFAGGTVTVGEYAFNTCPNLETITFEENSGLTAIGKNAFSGCENLERVILPESLKTIEDGAFSACRKLYSVVLPKSLESIGANAFQSTAGGITFYYTGTQTEWSQISGNDRYIFDVTSVYYYQETDGSGRYWHYVDGIPTRW